MSQLYRFPDGSIERRYTRIEAGLILTLRGVVLLLCLPFLLMLQGVAPVAYEKLPTPSTLRLIGGEFYP